MSMASQISEASLGRRSYVDLRRRSSGVFVPAVAMIQPGLPGQDNGLRPIVHA